MIPKVRSLECVGGGGGGCATSAEIVEMAGSCLDFVRRSRREIVVIAKEKADAIRTMEYYIKQKEWVAAMMETQNLYTAAAAIAAPHVYSKIVSIIRAAVDKDLQPTPTGDQTVDKLLNLEFFQSDADPPAPPRSEREMVFIPFPETL